MLPVTSAGARRVSGRVGALSPTAPDIRKTDGVESRCVLIDPCNDGWKHSRAFVRKISDVVAAAMASANGVSGSSVSNYEETPLEEDSMLIHGNI